MLNWKLINLDDDEDEEQNLSTTFDNNNNNLTNFYLDFEETKQGLKNIFDNEAEGKRIMEINNSKNNLESDKTKKSLQNIFANEDEGKKVLESNNKFTENNKKKLNSDVSNIFNSTPNVENSTNKIYNNKQITSLKNNNQILKNIDTSKMNKATSNNLKAMKEAEKINEQIENGGVDKFIGITSLIFKNILGGTQSTVSGYAGFGLTLLANIVNPDKTDIIQDVSKSQTNNKEFNEFQQKADKQFNETYGINSSEENKTFGDMLFPGMTEKRRDVRDAIIDKELEIKDKGDYISTINSHIDDDVARTVGQVVNTATGVVSNATIGSAIGIDPTIMQGISVAGNSEAEILEKNPEDTQKALTVGSIKGTVSYATEKVFDSNILTRGQTKSSIQNAVDDFIYDHIKGKKAREFANIIAGIGGENAEELLEDNVDYVIDAFAQEEGFPNRDEWLKNTKETAIVTTLSTILLNVLRLRRRKI